MEITFLGTGSSTPTPHLPLHSYSGFSVEIENDFLLFDIGPGTVTKLLQNGIDIQKNPTDLFLSHFHLDHCLDYITLLKARGLYAKYHGKQEKLLRVFGPPGLEKLSRNLFEGIPDWKYMSDELRVFEQMTLKETTKGSVVKNPTWNVTVAPIHHYNGVCYRLESGGKSLIYSGDMGYDKTIAELGKNADIAILECSYPSKEEKRGLHLYPEEIGDLAKKGGFKHVILTHMYPDCEGREEEMVNKIKSLAKCEVTVAYDTLRLEL